MMGLPVRRILETGAAMVGLEVNAGAIHGLVEASAESLGPGYEGIHREVLRSYLVQPDETSMRMGGKTGGRGAAPTSSRRTTNSTPSRGQEVVERALGRDFAGTGSPTAGVPTTTLMGSAGPAGSASTVTCTPSR